MYDSFTASSALEALGKDNNDSVVDVLKSTANRGGPSDEARAFFAENEGKRVRVLHTSYEATVHKLNEATSGFYPGCRYPIYVKIVSSGDAEFERAVGYVFEYALSQLEVIDRHEQT